MNDMKINSVKLVDSGLKGIEVKYAMVSTKEDGPKFIDEHTSKKKSPAHRELKDAFAELRSHLLDICEYGDETREGDLMATEVTSVTYNDKGFVIVGNKTVLSDKSINLVSPLITSGNDYYEFGAVLNILDKIYAETKAYMDGDKTFNNQQFVIDFNTKNKVEGFDEATFLALSEEEQKAFSTKILEKFKSIVIHIDEMEVSENQELVDNIIAAENEEELIEAQAPEVIEEKVSPMRVVTGDGEDFSIVMDSSEVKKSTAKRKTAI